MCISLHTQMLLLFESTQPAALFRAASLKQTQVASRCRVNWSSLYPPWWGPGKSLIWSGEIIIRIWAPDFHLYSTLPWKLREPPSKLELIRVITTLPAEQHTSPDVGPTSLPPFFFMLMFSLVFVCAWLEHKENVWNMKAAACWHASIFISYFIATGVGSEKSFGGVFDCSEAHLSLEAETAPPTGGFHLSRESKDKVGQNL